MSLKGKTLFITSACGTNGPASGAFRVSGAAR
jgi:hypothetical protein